MKHGYIAGSLFSEAEIRQRLYEGEALKNCTKDRVEWFNPIEAPCNDKSKLPTAEDIFSGDTAEILKCDYIVADLSNNDPGVMMELGVAWGLNHCFKSLLETFDEFGINPPVDFWDSMIKKGIKPKEVHAVLSDIRIGNAHEYKGIKIPMSYNQYVIGGIENMGGKVHSSFDDVVKEL